VVPKDVTGVGADGKRVSLHALWSRRHTTKFNGASYVVQRGAAAAYSPEGLAQTRAQVAFYMEERAPAPRRPRRGRLQDVRRVHAPYLWLETAGGATSWQFFDRLLSEAPGRRNPGLGLRSGGEGYFRLSAFNSRANIEEAISDGFAACSAELS